MACKLFVGSDIFLTDENAPFNGFDYFRTVSWRVSFGSYTEEVTIKFHNFSK
jgi:hypothetical protein